LGIVLTTQTPASVILSYPPVSNADTR